MVVSRMHRVFWVPARYRSVAAVVLDGQKVTIRELAARTGYSVMGAHHALAAMARLGLGVLTKARGRKGWTRFRMQDDVAVQRNVRTTSTFVEESYEVTRTVVGTFPEMSVAT